MSTKKKTNTPVLSPKQTETLKGVAAAMHFDRLDKRSVNSLVARGLLRRTSKGVSLTAAGKKAV